jgi:hypothetical protein
MVKAAQQLHQANGCRRRCEQLKHSFPQPDQAPEAAQRVNMLVAQYGQHITASRDEFRLAESEFAARAFRFPDRVARLVQGAVQSLSEFGRLVNDGAFDKADLQFAKFHDDYRQIVKEGRGWRLADPLEGILRHFRKKKQEEVRKDKYGLSPKDMEAILALVHKRATSQADNTFAVHPPSRLLEHPEIALSEKVIDELDNSVFEVAFQDGTAKMMSLVELMIFTYNLIFLAQQMAELNRMMQVTSLGPRQVDVTLHLSVDEIMRPDMVRALLSKIEFSQEPSDAEPTKQSA